MEVVRLSYSTVKPTDTPRVGVVVTLDPNQDTESHTIDLRLPHGPGLRGTRGSRGVIGDLVEEVRIGRVILTYDGVKGLTSDQGTSLILERNFSGRQDLGMVGWT